MIVVLGYLVFVYNNNICEGADSSLSGWTSQIGSRANHCERFPDISAAMSDQTPNPPEESSVDPVVAGRLPLPSKPTLAGGVGDQSQMAAASAGIKDDDAHETSPNGQRYVKLNVLLGSGAYKDVWRAYDTREGIEVAWNVIKLKRIPVNDRKRVKNEVLLLKEIEHKNIIKYHSSWIDREKQCVIFITEIMSSGSLKE